MEQSSKKIQILSVLILHFFSLEEEPFIRNATANLEA